MNAIPTLEQRLMSPNELLAELQARFDSDTEDYNAVVDECERLQNNCDVLILQVSTLQTQLDDLKSQNESLIAGNKHLLAEGLQMRKNLELSGKQLEAARRKEQASTEKSAVLEKRVKELTAHGDIKKIIEQNKTQRERNSELLNELSKVKRLLADSDKLLDQCVVRGGEYFNLPIFRAPNDQVIYMHDKRTRVMRDGVEHWVIPMTMFTPEGVGRLMTWDGERVHFASTGHKTADQKLAPHQDLVDFAATWFRENISIQGVNQMLRKRTIKAMK